MFYHGLCTLNEQLYIVAEYLPLGDLESFFRTDKGRSLPVNDLMWICLHVARGMNHIHSDLKINHNDLACRNILLSKSQEGEQGEGNYNAKVAGELISFYLFLFNFSPRFWACNYSNRTNI